MTKQFDSFAEAYWHSVSELVVGGVLVEAVADPHSPGSNFGTKQRTTQEIVNHCFVLRNPRNRLAAPEMRRINLPFAIANVIWTLKGTSELSMIVRYNSRGAKFSRNGAQVEAAFGSRLFGASSQIAEAIRRLKSDRSSRRAFAAIYDGSDSSNDRLDVPCAIGAQFLVREGALHCVVIMRSQSAVMVLPYDIFLFTLVHEYVARSLGLPLGTYTHHSISFHYYEDEAELARAVCSTPLLATNSIGLPELACIATQTLVRVYEVEEALRSSDLLSQIERIDVQSLGLDSFWETALGVLKVFFLRQLGATPTRADWNWLPVAYQNLLW